MKTHCGYVALIGRPNVGKSTIMNCILGQKISITSRKPQTTRHRILGIKTVDSTQALYVDTPGLHQSQKRALNRYMLQATKSAIVGVDVIVFVVDAFGWRDEDDLVLQQITRSEAPVILVINKIDQIKDRSSLLPYLEEAAKKYPFKDIIPVAAKNNTSIDRIETAVNELLPEGPLQYGEDELTDKSTRFLVSEIVREKLTRLLGQELPHELTVEIEKYVEDDEAGVVKIAALIYVARPGQKAIVVGHKGEVLKRVGMEARKDIENLIEEKVFLQLWVKVKKDWFDNARLLNDLGYTE